MTTAPRSVSFQVKGDTLAATLYPAAVDKLRGKRGYPAIVMAHGLSMTRDSGLSRYAERFAAAGIVALVFDYRCFGDSTGTPRELVSAHQQVEDYHGALAYVRGLPQVDAQRTAIWGTSYSGGVALQCAHEDRRYRALILQVPNLDNAATGLYMALQIVRRSPGRGLWLAARAVLDAGAGLLGLPAVYTRAIGREGEPWAAYVNDESAGYIDEIRGSAWRNRIALRDFVRLPIFRPVRHAKSIPGPIMIIAAERDDLTPLAPVLRAAELAGERAELHRYPVTHFEVYTGELLQELVAKEVAFLERALAASNETGASQSALH